MSKLPCSEGEAYGSWHAGTPPVEIQVQATGPHGHARGALSLTDGDAKRALRVELAARRAAIVPADRRARARAVADRLEALDAFARARAVGAYAGLGAELDPAEIVGRALARGVRIAWPRARPGERVLEFAACAPEALVRGPHGALEPPPSAPALRPDELDAVLVPAVAFSEDGLRLGRGGGHYDATLAGMPRARRIGLAFDEQIVASLPREAHDVRMDAVVTDRRALAFARDSG
jgi:5-formyltetrahydrofolate cyclo-ligase